VVGRRAGWRWRLGVAAKGEGRWWSLPDHGGLAESGWSVNPRRLRAGEWRNSAARSPHTAHELHPTKICYRCHPFYGVEVEVIRYLRRIDSVILIVRLPGGSQIAVPDWMLIPGICDRFTNEAEPRVSIDALFELRRLLDTHCLGEAPKDHSCAKSPSGGNNAQQRKSVRVATQAALRGRRDLDRASGNGKGTVPNSVAPGARKRAQDRPREAE
jgi:hypothetical protein